MPSYTDPFGGSTVQTAQVAYRAFALAANLALAWPQQTSTDANVAARTMDVSPSGAGFALALPQANQVSVGYDLLITNRGAFSFTLTDYTGVTVATLSAGQSKYVQVTVNATTAGTWNVISFGVGTSSVDAASLVGPGIGASGSTLYASEPVSTISVGNTITAADRAKTYVWTGGLGTQQLPAAGAVTDFFYSVRNQGTGALTIAANGVEQVDGASSIVLQPAESATVHAGVGNWYSVGRGRSAQFNFTLLIKNITGGTVTLTTTEAANVVQRYTGVLASNANVVLPSVVQVYYVSNQTTGAFTVTFKTAGVGSTISVPSNQNAVLFCDGTNVINASTTVSGLTALLLAQGSATAPSLGYSGDSSTGIYQPASSQVAITLAGTQRVLVATTGITSTLPILGPLGAVGAPTYSYSADPDTGMWSPGANLLTFSVGGAEGLRLSASQVSTASPFVFAPWLGAVGTPSYSFTGDLNTGMWSPAADTLAWSVNGAEGTRLNTTGFGVGGVPANKLDVFGGASGSNVVARVVNTQGTANSGALLSLDPGNNGFFNRDAFIQAINDGSNHITLKFWVSNAASPAVGITLNPDLTTAFAGNVSVPLGAVGTPSYSFTGDLNTGVWSAGADLLSFSAGGTERMRASGSNSGVKFFGQGSSASDVGTLYSFLTGDKILWIDPSRTANNKEAEFTWSGGIFQGRFVNDAYSLGTTWLQVTGGQAAGIASIDFATGASVQTMRLAGQTVNIGPGTATALYQVQVEGLGQVTGAPTDGGAKGASIYLRDSGTGGAGAGGFLAFGGFDGPTPFAGIKGYITDAAGNQRGDIVIANRRLTTDTALTESIRIWTDGRLSGKALHNNANGVAGTADQYIASGTYTPTLNNLLNIAASTAYACQWMRVGNVVTVSGKVDIQPTSGATSTSLGISLPITSTFAAANNAGGTGSSLAGGTVPAMILADNTTPRLLYQFFNSGVVSNSGHHFSATYLIL